MPIQMISDNTNLTDVVLGDSYPLSISGTIIGTSPIVTARLMIKSTMGLTDASALVDFSVTAIPTAHGLISMDGSGEDNTYQVLMNILPTDTAKLVYPSDPVPTAPTMSNQLVWEVRLSTADGQEYTPIRAQPLLALPRLIDLP